ncbi:hypothetical protein AB0M36_32135 [Actinoplanes sp. NPDC051346]|uniref:hypothetical protein n=1 Tax=Actinoplanes sp. NPDC051346 TaxID=3155048 RepID=UPI00342BA9FD
MAPPIVPVARNLGASVIGAARSALGIASPSRVFAGIGDQVVAGFVQGIERAAPAAATATRRLTTTPYSITGAGVSGPADLREQVINLSALVKGRGRAGVRRGRDRRHPANPTGSPPPCATAPGPSTAGGDWPSVPASPRLGGRIAANE